MDVGVKILSEQEIYELSTTKQAELGSPGIDGKGGFYRYVKFGGTSTVNPGLVLQGPAAPSNSTGLAITAVGTGGQVTANLQGGSRQIVVTNGTTSVTTDQFAGGLLAINTSTDSGFMVCNIDGNTSAGSGGYITVTLKDPIPKGATQLVPGTDTVDLLYSKFNGPTASTTGNAPVGVTIQTVPNTSSVTNYGWVKSGGIAKVNATTATIGLGVACDLAGTAGYVIISAATTGNIGWAKTSAASSAAVIDLNIY